MNNLLQEYYKYDLVNSGYIDRKYDISQNHTSIFGITQCGKTSLIKNYLLKFKKSTYLYLDCLDYRIDIDELNELLESFCTEHKIEILALDNYHPSITLPSITQIIIASDISYSDEFEQIHLMPLDYEEFLAFESRYDDSSFSNFIQLGGLIGVQKSAHYNRMRYIQQALSTKLSEIKMAIMATVAKNLTLKISAYNIYERLKQHHKISKDKLYQYFSELIDYGYIIALDKYAQSSATKKLYLCDIAIQYALTTQRNFSRIFENIAFLELYKKNIELYYIDGFDFYIPSASNAIIVSAFADEREIYKKIQSLESSIFSYGITSITIVTMNSESFLSHPMAKIELISLQRWALSLE